MPSGTPTLLVEGWRFIPHSYACVNMWQLLELSKRTDMHLVHRDMPFFQEGWRRTSGMFDPVQERALHAVAGYSSDVQPDLVYRIFAPLSLTPECHAGRTCVFATAEWCYLAPEYFGGNLSGIFYDERLQMITPSLWSKNGLMRSGVPSERITVVPHGTDTTVFRPLDAGSRSALRKQLGWEGRFVFLHIGAMTENKGVSGLIRAFAQVHSVYPETLLVLKGSDGLFDSRGILTGVFSKMSGSLPAQLLSCIEYRGEDVSFSALASLYQAADVYVSPYLGEGFNMPVLEAMASGLPVICTKGGATDDFIDERCTLLIKSRLKPFPGTPYLFLEPDMACLIELMKKVVTDGSFCRQAQVHGPQHVRSAYSWCHVADRLAGVLFAGLK